MMKQLTRAQYCLLPLVLSSFAFTGCSQLQNKKSDNNKMTTTTSVSKSGGYGGKNSKGGLSSGTGGLSGLIGSNDIMGSSSTTGLDSQDISASDLGGNSKVNGFGEDADAQAAIDALMAEGKKHTPADVNNPQSILAQRVIYFDYDQATISEKYTTILAAHAELLANYPEMRIRLEGHADERGSREYNVALSERRAETVRQYLSFKNVGSEQMETVAFGEEKPLVPSHNDTAWNKNRRVEINYLTY
jgi:peptidoglycan-associated lipoprotein